MANLGGGGGGQFPEGGQFPDRFPPPGAGRKRPSQEFGPPGGDGDLDQGFNKRGRFDEGGRGGVPPATLRVLVRQQDAGGIIGKGGENIKRLRKMHDCQVVLPDSPGAPERVMTMMGRIEGCVGVLGDCLPKLGDGPVQQGETDAAFEIQVLIPQPFMGTIIGTGGTKIKELRSKTRTSIKIFSEPMPNSNERSVQIIGTESQISECVEYFLEEISKKEPREPIYLYEPAAEAHGDMFPPPGDFLPRRGGRSFRGGRDRDGGGGGGGGGGGRGFRGGGRGGRNGADRGRGHGGGGGGSFHGSWNKDRDTRGPGGGASHQPPYQPPPNPARPPLMNPQQLPPTPSLIPPGGPPTLFPSASQPVSLTSHAPPNQYPPPLGSTNTAQPPLVGTSSYSNPPAQLQAGSGAGYGVGQASVGYSTLPQHPTSAPSLGQAGVPPMYMPPSAPSMNPQPSHMAPHPGQQTQQVTIPGEYAMSILGMNGGNLEMIKGQTSCDIMINDPKPGTAERIISITGAPANIQRAQTLMQNSVRQYHTI